MADIKACYDYICEMAGRGAVVLDGREPYGLSPLLNQLRLPEIRIQEPAVSPLFIDGRFELTGSFGVDSLAGRRFGCRLKFTGNGERIDGVLEAEYVPGGGALLNDLYPPARARIAENFYVRPVDVFENTYVSLVRITGDTRKADDAPGFSLTLYYTEECPLYQLYDYFIPNPMEEIRFEGTADNPFGAAQYTLQAAYHKSVSLPFLRGDVAVNELRLTLWSHVEDVYVLNTEGDTKPAPTMCRLELGMRLPLPALSGREVTLSYCLFGHSQSFFLKCSFGEQGLSVGDAFRLIVGLTGKQDTAELPEWIDTGSLTLKGMTLRFEKDICARRNDRGKMVREDLFSMAAPSVEGLFIGGAFYFDLKLPSLPVPFFDRTEGGGARIQFGVQWDSLDIGGQLTMFVGFHALWRRHRILLNIDIPSLYFSGEYAYLPAASGEDAPNDIFPGFLDLAVSDIRLSGSLRNNTYLLDIDLVNNGAHHLPVGKALFQIEYVKGSAAYAPNGVSLSLELGITLFTAYFALYAKYAKSGKEQLLTIRGGLKEEFYLSNLIALITGRNLECNEMDFAVKALYFSYVTALPDYADGTAPSYAVDSLGTVREFSFLCSIEFSWISGSIGSTFHMQYKNAAETGGSLSADSGEYTYKISAQLELLDNFLFAASCTVLVAGGEYSFENFEFRTKIRTVEVIATYADEEKNLTFTVLDFNMGELLEGLINLFHPDHNWYLPWPFTILKQITIKELAVFVDTKNETIKARLMLRFQLLFLEVEYIELFYDHRNEDFWVNIKVKAGNEVRMDEEGDLLNLNLLKDIFPSIEGLGSQLLDIRYLAVGQHIDVEVPDHFDETQFPVVVENIKKGIKKSGRPALNADNNWVFALQLQLIKAIDITLLMCDPGFYGAELSISKGSEFTDQLAGLKVTVLYSKINETIGMFHAKLTLPEVFRVIDIGAVQIRLGEIALSIYTNGNFKIDLGFPYNKDFTRSFGLTYLFFTGKGGFYFGLLNGDTSKAVPQVSKGHFETVIELGIGISAGVGREISMGPLKAGAYIMIVALFQGVFATYVPKEDAESSYYYKVQATAGVTASVYGCVDFVLIKVGFSVNASFLMDLTLERYERTILALDLDISVEAYIKILFVKISFSFRFHWQDTMELGSRSAPPWEIARNADRRKEPVREYSAEWYDGTVFEEKRHLFIDVIPYFSYDQVALDEPENKTPKIAFLGILNGFQDNSYKILRYARIEDTPLPVLAEALLRRLIRSVRVDGEAVEGADRPLLEWLHGFLDSPGVYETGFLPERVESFLKQNLYLNYAKGENVFGREIHGIPFPLPQDLKLTWFSAPDKTEVFDLSRQPMTDAGFFQRMEAYYSDLYVDIPVKDKLWEESQTYSASAHLFTQYFYMLSKILLSEVISNFPEDASFMPLDGLIEIVRQEAVLDAISGMLSRFCYGGVRSVINDQNDVESLYSYALQQFDALPAEGFAPDTVIHRMKMEFFPDRHKPVRLLGRMEYLNQSNGPAEELYADSETVLEWEFRAEDLAYPAGTLRMRNTPSLLPFYVPRPQTIELKNPNKAAGAPSVTFLEAAARLPEEFSIVLQAGEEAVPAEGFVAGTLLYLPAHKIGKNLFDIGSMGVDNIARLNELKKETGLTLEIYRLTNPLDTDNCGFAPLSTENVFLYRTNLCLEAEKPMLSRTAADTSFENSAFLTEGQSFISLLSDAALVNSKGYYLQLELDEPHAVQEGEVQFVLFAASHLYQDAVRLSVDYDRETQKPTVWTRDIYYVPAYEPGTLAFAVPAETPDDDLKRAFQMLRYQIAGNDYFRESHESAPLIARPDESDKERQTFTQIVPASRFARHKPGTEEAGPYGGIAENSVLSLKFSLLDILGNESSGGRMFHIPYGYTDRLVSPATYPYTKCAYYVEDGGGSYDFYVEFSYKEETQSDKKRLVKEAYWQIMCEDVRLRLYVLGTEKELDLTPLRDYMEKLYLGKETPAPVCYHAQAPKPAADWTAVDIRLVLSRRESLLAQSLKNRPEAEGVLRVCQAVREDEQKITQSFLARRGSDGQIFIIKNQPLKAGASASFTLPPLCNKLIQLNDIRVLDMDQGERRESFHDIDLEVWADEFLYDFESFLAPGSVYSRNRELLEELLRVKKGLAARISSHVTSVTAEYAQGAFYEKARQFYENEMLRSIYSGRKMDAVYLFRQEPGSFLPGEGSALCFSVKEESGEAAVKAGKMDGDGLIALGIRARDIAGGMSLHSAVKLSVTDIEIAGSGQYEYLTLLKTAEQAFDLNCELPYKRFPGLPVLLEHDYMASGSGQDYFGYSYHMAFSHEAADQDLITVRLVLDLPVRGCNDSVGLPEALAQYMSLREGFLQAKEDDEKAQEMLLKVSQGILDTWDSIEAVKRSENARCYYVTFSMDRRRMRLRLADTDLKPERIEIQMRKEDGTFALLERQGDTYVIPDADFSVPYVFSFWFHGFQVQTQSSINSYVSVSRNQNISDIRPCFIYQTEETAFAKPLLPWIQNHDVIRLGEFERTNFTDRLGELAEGFGGVKLELYCGIPVGRDGLKRIYSYLPMFYVPQAAADEVKDVTAQLYEKAAAWLGGHFKTLREGTAVRVNASFYDGGSGGRNLAEFSSLFFEIR